MSGRAFAGDSAGYLAVEHGFTAARRFPPLDHLAWYVACQTGARSARPLDY
jgi:hypothetical protein